MKLAERHGCRTSIADYMRPHADRTLWSSLDATISVPDLGDAQAAGLTVDQLESMLGPALAAQLNKPNLRSQA